MSTIVFIASRVWCFFSLLGQVGTMPLRYVLMDYYIITADNPFNDFSLEVDVGAGDNIIGDVLNIITRVLGVADYTVFEGLLFTFAGIFVISIFARLISFVTPD